MMPLANYVEQMKQLVGIEVFFWKVKRKEDKSMEVYNGVRRILIINVFKYNGSFRSDFNNGSIQ